MTKVQAFLLDLVEGAVVGAALVVVGLPESVSGKEALALALAGAIGGTKAAARLALKAFLESRKKPA